jgi:SAM-dependent methyltransferase
MKELAILDGLLIGKGKIVADIGVGWGDYLPFFVQRGFSVLALDKQLTGLDRIKAANEEKAPVFVVAADANVLPVKTGSVDVVFMGQVLEHLVDPKIALKEARRILRDKGLLFVDVPWLHQVYKPLSACGLRLLRSYKLGGRMPFLLRLLFTDKSNGVRTRPFIRPVVKLIERAPLLRGMRVDRFIEAYLQGRDEKDFHRHFLYPREWRTVMESAGFAVRRMTGAWITPALLGGSSLANGAFGSIERRLSDKVALRLARILILVGEKTE